MSWQNEIQKGFKRVDNKLKAMDKTRNKVINDYRKLLKNHDWYSEYSDDHSVWEKSAVEYTQIMCMAQQIDSDYKIFNEYAPDEYKKESNNG